MDLWERKLKDTFKKQTKTEEERFLDVVSMVIYNNVHNTDIAKLYSAVDLETFLLIVNLFEGRTLEFPTKKELRDSIELALFYYYKECLGIRDYEVLRKLDLLQGKDFSSISIGKRLARLNKEVLEKITNMEDVFDFEKENDDE